MSFWAHADALRMELPCPEKMVLAILCHYASDDNQSCWASVETLAFTVGVTPQTVRNKLKSLKQKGYINRVIERPGTTTVYVLDFAKIQQDARPRPLKEVDPSKRLSPQGGLGDPSTSLTPPLNVVDPINNDKQGKTKPPKSPKGEKPDFGGAVVPKSLEPIRESLIEWQTYKRSKRQDWKKQTWEMNFRKYGDQPHVLKAMIEHTIEMGYQGLLMPKDGVPAPASDKYDGFKVMRHG